MISRSLRSLIILFFDLTTVIGLFSLVYYLRLEKLPNYLHLDLWLVVFTFIITFFVSGTYSRSRSTKLPRLPVRTFFISGLAGLICIFWVYLSGPYEFNNYFGRGVLPIGTILVGITATLSRFLINRAHHNKEVGIKLLYLGFSDSGQAFLNELKNHSEVRSVSLVTNKTLENSFEKIKIIKIDKLISALNNQWYRIIIDPSHHSRPDETNQLVALRLSGTRIMSLAEYYEQEWYMVPVHHIKDDWFLQSQGFSMVSNPISLRIKRIIDILLALVLLIATSPLVLLSAILIKLTSKGPVFFKQTRVGFKGDLFTIYKLRTMIRNAEKNGAQWASNDDPRVTIIGNFLRKSRLDELPQCWNVLKGDMSFVGPRPERPEFTKDLADCIPYYNLRHTVKPGITGWAQVIFPYGASQEDALKKLQYELYYIKNQSLLLDLNVILRTSITVFQRTGR